MNQLETAYDVGLDMSIEKIDRLEQPESEEYFYIKDMQEIINIIREDVSELQAFRFMQNFKLHDNYF